MTRYVIFVIWAIAGAAGTFLAGGPAKDVVHTFIMILLGGIVANWQYGTHNPTGLPFFNPPEKKKDSE